MTKHLRRGSALIEFALTSLLWVPLLMGTAVVGLSLARSIEAMQICRDAGHMHAYGVDFSQPNNKQVLLKLASDFNLQLTGGNGVVILSTIVMVGASDCALAPGTACSNLGQPVFVTRIVVGNSGLRSSAFGAPNGSDLDSSGNIAPAKYLNDTSDRASVFNSTLALAPSQRAYISESYFAFPDLAWAAITSVEGAYSQAIF